MFNHLSLYIVGLRNFVSFALTVIAIVSITNTTFQFQANRANSLANLTARPLKGAVILTQPKTISVGKQISRQEIISYLKEIGLVDIASLPASGNNDLIVGSYGVDSSKNQLRLRSAIDDHLFPPLTIEWNRKNQITRIISNDSEATSAQIEGFHFNNRVYETDVENTETKIKNFVVIRIPTRGFVLQGKPIYFVTQGSEGAFDVPVSPKNIIGSIYRNYIKRLFGSKPGNQTGGSTPTMQLCRAAILHDKRDSFIRKIKEIYCASDLAARLSEPQIAESYFNHVFYGIWRGEALYGVETAAQRIFGKTAADLDLYESAFICALAPTPSRLRKIAAGDIETIAKHKARIDAILDRTLERYPNQFTQQQISEAKTQTPKFSKGKSVTRQTRFDLVVKPFVQKAFDEAPTLRENIDPATLNVTASEMSDAVYTTQLDPDLMFAANRILAKHLKLIRSQFPPIDEKGKSVKDDLMGVITIINPTTGEVIALIVGSSNPNREISALYTKSLVDPGSQKKVYDIAAALESGQFTPATIIEPSKGKIIERCNGQEWRPKMGVGNAKNVADVLSDSDDGGIVFIVNQIGLEQSNTFFERLTGSHIESLQTKTNCQQYASVNSIGFGRMGSNPVRLVEGISPFGASGQKNKIRFLSGIHFEENTESAPSLPVSEPEQIITPETAYQMMYMMRRVMFVGTAANLPFSDYLRKNPNLMVGCKTGSGEMAVGFSCVAPAFASSVQIFYANGSRFKQSQNNQIFAAKTSAAVFSDLMMEAIKMKKNYLFQGEIPRPEGVTEVKVDWNRGCRDDSGVTMPFRKGTEPEYCSTEISQDTTGEKVYVLETRDGKGLNLYEEKDFNSPSLKTAPEGSQIKLISCETEQVTINGRLGSWCQAESEGITGWAWGWGIKEIPQ